jgi:hypothetical protein
MKVTTDFAARLYYNFRKKTEVRNPNWKEKFMEIKIIRIVLTQCNIMYISSNPPRLEPRAQAVDTDSTLIICIL